MSPETRDALGIELIEPSCSIFDIGHKTCVFEYLEVLRNCGTGHGHDVGELVDGEGAAAELLEDRHAGGIRKCVEPGL